MIFILEDNESRIARFSETLGVMPHRIERTVADSMEWLSINGSDVSVYSLDNDLYLPGTDGDPGEGWQLCSWMTKTQQKAPVVIHSSNSDAAFRMMGICTKAGWECSRVVPLDHLDWISKSWRWEIVRLIANAGR